MASRAKSVTKATLQGLLCSVKDIYNFPLDITRLSGTPYKYAFEVNGAKVGPDRNYTIQGAEGFLLGLIAGLDCCSKKFQQLQKLWELFGKNSDETYGEQIDTFITLEV